MTQPRQEPRPAAPSAGPIDLAAVLSALQDQIDDLTTVVDAHQRRIGDLERQQRG